MRLQRAKSKSEQAEVLYFCKVLRYTVWYHHVFVSLLALTRCQPRLGRAPEGSLKLIQSPQTIIVLQAFALALGPALRTTGGAQSATRTTTVRRTPTTSAATRTGASSRGRRVIAHSAGPFLLLLLSSSSFLPASHMVTKTRSTHMSHWSAPMARPSPRTRQTIKQNKVN